MSGKGNPKHTAKPSSLERSSLERSSSERSSLERTGNNKILAEELHKPVIKQFNKRKVYSLFRDNIWRVDLADTQSLSKKKISFMCYGFI